MSIAVCLVISCSYRPTTDRFDKIHAEPVDSGRAVEVGQSTGVNRSHRMDLAPSGASLPARPAKH